MLLVYPGALVDIFYKIIARERYDDSDEHDIMRLARYFIMSGVISVLSLTILSLIRHDNALASGAFEGLEVLQTGWNSVLYFIIATSIAFIFALLRKHPFDWLMRYIANLRHSSLKTQKAKSPWHEIISSTKYDWTDIFCIISHGKNVIACGFVESLPDDITKTPAIALKFIDISKDALEKDEACENDDERYIGATILDYVLLDSGYSVKFCRANKLVEEINKLALG
jgi:hypothetical protein